MCQKKTQIASQQKTGVIPSETMTPSLIIVQLTELFSHLRHTRTSIQVHTIKKKNLGRPNIN